MKPTLLILGALSLLFSSVYAADPVPLHGFKVAPDAVPLIFPVRMLNDGVSHGTVRTLLHVDAQGRLVDLLVIACTKQAFADEVERTVRKWRFEPSIGKDGPVDTIVDTTFNFEVNGVLMVQKFIGSDRLMPEFMKGYDYQACSIKRLDSIPVPLNMVSPTYPIEWMEKGITGTVIVDFYIDESGRVRMATATGPHEWLVGIAIAAVNQWKFSPPTHKGSPVLVHAQQVFDFSGKHLAVK